jgi:hypothetical protein
MTYTYRCVYSTPDDGQRNCSKRVEFYYKNKFEKLVHLVGFIIRIYHDARSSGCQIRRCVVSVVFKLKLKFALSVVRPFVC